MKYLELLFAFSMVFCVFGAMAIADNHQQDMQQQAGAMGAPPEMKECRMLIGDWDVVQKWKMDPTSDEWMTEEGTSTFEYALDGATVIQHFESQMMGMPFAGLGMTSFNRETGMWQTSWVDNMGAQIMLMEGDMHDDKMVMDGTGLWNSQKYWARVSFYNMTDDRFEWSYEMSMDGKNFVQTGHMVYSKKK